MIEAGATEGSASRPRGRMLPRALLWIAQAAVLTIAALWLLDRAPDEGPGLHADSVLFVPAASRCAEGPAASSRSTCASCWRASRRAGLSISMVRRIRACSRRSRAAPTMPR
jgi:hypothetical protein